MVKKEMSSFRKFGLIGYPLGHSFSEKYFNEKFNKGRIDALYSLYPISEISLFEDLCRNENNLYGLNVTIPYKEAVIPFLTDLSEEAERIGAVNVIKFNRSNKGLILTGYNSDYVGFRDSLQPLLKKEVRKALILGTGGASKAVAFALDQLGIEYKFVSRHPSGNQLSYSELDKEIIEEYLLIVNTTPLGMYPDSNASPDIPYHLLTPSHICYDLIYNPETTEFMRKSREMGATVKNGLEMLYLQAEEAWRIWNI